jgi:multiple sugar transport system ATP-binding protein
MAAISMRSVNKAYGKTRVIENVNLDVDEGEFAVFVGPSGCGKSTLLRMVAGLEDITSGDLSIGGKRVNDLPPSQRGVAMVFQSYALYPHMTVYENMAFGLKLAKTDNQTIDQRVRNAGRILQLEHLLERLPKELSGGQRQRVAIGRAIVREPRVFLFDEPLSNLDAALRVQTRMEIARLHSSLSASMIYVTHDQVEAMTLADKILLLNAGEAVLTEGSVAQIGAPLELYHQPQNLFVAGFIGSPKMNFIKGELQGSSGGKATVKTAGGALVEADLEVGGANGSRQVTLGIRPEHTEIVGSEVSGIGVTEGKVAYLEQLGEASYIYLDMAGLTEGQHVIVRQEGDTSVNEGDTVHIRMASQNCHLFNEQGKAFKRRIDVSKQTEPVLD